MGNAFLRKAAKEYGTRRYAEGASLVGTRFVLIEDVVSSGGALLDTLALLRADGLTPLMALSVIDRRGNAPDALAAAGLRFRGLFTRAELEVS